MPLARLRSFEPRGWAAVCFGERVVVGTAMTERNIHRRGDTAHMEYSMEPELEFHSWGKTTVVRRGKLLSGRVFLLGKAGGMECKEV